MNKWIKRALVVILVACGVAVGAWATKIGQTSLPLSEQPVHKVVSVGHCIKARILILGDGEGVQFSDNAVSWWKNIPSKCFCFIRIGEGYDAIKLITTNNVARGGYDISLSDDPEDNHHVDNIVKQLTGQEMPEEWCK